MSPEALFPRRTRLSTVVFVDFSCAFRVRYVNVSRETCSPETAAARRGGVRGGGQAGACGVGVWGRPGACDWRPGLLDRPVAAGCLSGPPGSLYMVRLSGSGRGTSPRGRLARLTPGPPSVVSPCGRPGELAGRGRPTGCGRGDRAGIAGGVRPRDRAARSAEGPPAVSTRRSNRRLPPGAQPDGRLVGLGRRASPWSPPLVSACEARSRIRPAAPGRALGPRGRPR